MSTQAKYPFDATFPRKTHTVVFAIFLLFLFFTSGFLYYTNEKKILVKNISNELTAIAELKSSQLSRWYRDELQDAAQIAISLDNEIFRACLMDGNEAACQRLERVIASIEHQHGYSELFFLAVDGRELLLPGRVAHSPDSMTTSCVESALRSGETLASEIFSLPGHKDWHIDFISPLRIGGVFRSAAIVCRFEEIGIISEMLQRQPLPGRLLQTEIVRVDEGNSLIIADPRHTAVQRRNTGILCRDSTAIEWRAVRGKNGITEGHDYLGRDVLAYVGKIPDTPWHIIVKTDRDEVYADLTFGTWMIAASVIFLLLTLGAGLSFFYTWRQHGIYQALWKTKEELRTTLYSIKDSVITTDETGVVQYLNASAERLIGWQENNAKGKKLAAFLHILLEATGEKIEDPVARTLQENKPLELANGIVVAQSDGRQIPVLMSASVIRVEGDRIGGVVLVLRDQTESRSKQHILEESERKYRTLFETTSEGIALYQNIYNSDAALIDLRRIDSNSKFNELFIRPTRNCKESDPHPSHVEHFEELLPICRLVEATSAPVISELHIGSINRHFIITAYAPENGRIAIMYHDITNRKHAEEALRRKMSELERFHRLTVDRELRMIELKTEVNILLNERGQQDKYSIV